MHQLMLVPTTACPASCRYCFGPHHGTGIMPQSVVAHAVRWLQRCPERIPAEITFHGGEPLCAGHDYYRQTLRALRDGLSQRSVRFSIQSNLWLLDDAYCDLFQEYGLSIGTSLDGPRDINDAQRGPGSFDQTMTAIARARRRGFDVGCICTFTEASFTKADEVFNFFLEEGLHFSIHSAVTSLRHFGAAEWRLSVDHSGELFVRMLERYLDQCDRIRISTLDALCRSVSAGSGGICTFGDCLGGYLAVGPDGGVYPCQRFADMPDYRMAVVQDLAGGLELETTAVWRSFRKREELIRSECGLCDFFAFCKGGCPYNALAVHGARFAGGVRDPLCEAYRTIFGEISSRALDELFSERNLVEVVETVDERRGLFRKGKLLELMRGEPHPFETAKHARRILASVALATTGSAETATRSLVKLGLARHTERTLAALGRLHRNLTTPNERLNNLYLHVTRDCNLSCTHCYAEAGSGQHGEITLTLARRIAAETACAGFRHLVITGGEPLVHSEAATLLDLLRDGRAAWKPTLTVLRTNLAAPLSGAMLKRIAGSADEVVVSVDGDRDTHDRRRGRGSYDRTIENLRRLCGLSLDCDLALAVVLPGPLLETAPGESVRALARELGIRRTRFRPVLPIGRALRQEPGVAPESIWGHSQPQEAIEHGFYPTSSCGIGQNLYVEPDGDAYPCYACHEPRWILGSLATSPLAEILGSEAFRRLSKYTVNTNKRCKRCSYRFLCGGACRAWTNLLVQEQQDLDAPPRNCQSLHSRARSVFDAALERLSLTRADWEAVGLGYEYEPPMPAIDPPGSWAQGGTT